MNPLSAIFGTVVVILILVGLVAWWRDHKTNTTLPPIEEQTRKNVQVVQENLKRNMESQYRQEFLENNFIEPVVDNHSIARSPHCFPKPDYTMKLFNNHDKCYLNIQRFRDYLANNCDKTGYKGCYGTTNQCNSKRDPSCIGNGCGSIN